MKSERLVIFDYSGTLSLEAALFSRPERLVAELKGCGLADLGIATPEVFWAEIVNPTWQEGSTTNIGYENIMKRCIRERLNPDVTDREIDRSVSSFVAKYFGTSTVHPQWRPILERVAGDETICGVVATDHYCEATGYIVWYLKSLGIDALSVESIETDVTGHFYVANSADLGAHKAERLFWERLKQSLSLEAVTDIIIVDDFGFNETAGDAYATLVKVDKRKALTESLLEETFSAPVETVLFTIEGSDDREGNRVAKISEVSDMITDRLWPPQKRSVY